MGISIKIFQPKEILKKYNPSMPQFAMGILDIIWTVYVKSWYWLPQRTINQN